MKSNVINGKLIASFDTDIVANLKLKDSDSKSIKAERMIVGIRNEDGEIYRAIWITGLDKFLGAVKKLNRLGFIDELEDADGPKGGFDAIFNRG